MYEIEIYEDKEGNSEINNYFEKLKNSSNKEDRIKINKIDMYLDLLSQYGLSLNEPYIKKISNDIWELRPLRDRILFATIKNKKIILLSIFMKKTQKTPRKEIKKAEKLFDDYKKRSDNNE